MRLRGSDVELKEAVERFLELGYHLSPEALELVVEEGVQSYLELVKRIRPPEPVLTREMLLDLREGPSGKVQERGEAPRAGPGGRESEGYEADVVVEKVAEVKPIKGEVEEFVRYFRSRLELLLNVLRERVPNILLPSQVGGREGETVTVAGLVREKISLRGGGLRVVIEDFSSQLAVIIPPENVAAVRIGERLLLDQVAAFRGRMGSRGLRAEAIVYPDVPAGYRPNAADVPLEAALISDVHVGSSYFIRELFDRFLEWLRGPEGGRVKYLIICGDLVDGVGIYPGQEEELDIPDIYKQYEEAARLLSEVPDDVIVIYIPGNHEPVRQAEPQPQIPREYAEPILEARDEVYMLTNPSVIRLNGVRFLLYHGRSLNAVFKYVPGLQPPTRETVVTAMSELLRVRHLAPIYGEHPILPSDRDQLVIDVIPDVIHMGHVHVYGAGTYRNVRVVNSGTFQGETPYIRGLGITPTPGIVPVVRLDTLEVREVDLRNWGG